MNFNFQKNNFQFNVEQDISKSMDIVFAVMHLNIQKCTVTLLSDLLPMILLNKTQYAMYLC